MFELDEDAKKILEIINQLDGDELKEFVDEVIQEHIQVSHEVNEDSFIGYGLTMNLRYNNLDITSKKNSYQVAYNTQYTGFIPSDVKVIYGRYVSPTNKMGTKGCYYYIDSYDYIYEFIKYIKNKNVEDNQSLIILVFFFLRRYFGVIGNLTRDNIHQLILKNEDDYFEPIKEHSILDFKGNNCAMCSEYSALVQNILSFFNYDISYIIGVDNNHPHAFNIVLLNNKYCLLDASYGVPCYVIGTNLTTVLPYVMPLEDYNDSDYQSFINDNTQLEVENYLSIILNNHYYAFPTDDDRKYQVLTKKI